MRRGERLRSLQQMRWLRSLPESGEVTDLVRSAYAVNVTGCSLARSLVNDVYLVTTPDERFALKVYQHGGRSVEEAAWEHDLAHSIAARVDVARPIALADGRPVGEVTYPEGPRAFAMSAWVEGRKPQPPFTDELYHDFGGSIALFHSAADGFSSLQRRPHFDVESDLDEPLGEVLDQLADKPADRDLIGELGAYTRDHLVGFGEQGVDWGVCHGDVSLDNIHLTDRGVVLHDFDRAREGWRGGDLTGVSATPHWDAFVAGYRERREIRPVDLESVPWLRVTDLIANLRFHLVLKPATHGTESLTEGWVDRELNSLRDLGIDLLPTA